MQMIRIAPLFAAAVVLAAWFGYAFGRHRDDVQTVVTSGAPAPAATSAPGSFDRPVPTPTADYYLNQCLPDDAAALSPADVASVIECLRASGVYGYAVSANDGRVPVTVFQLTGPHVGYTGNMFAVWPSTSKWQLQLLSDGGYPVGELLQINGQNPPRSAPTIREAQVGGTTLLALFVDGLSGSTSPHMSVVLLAYEQADGACAGTAPAPRWQR